MQDDISRMSKKELERALRSQIQNGQWAIEKAKAEQRERDIIAHENFVILFEQIRAIELLIVMIDQTAVSGRGQLMLDHLKGKAGLLADAYTELLMNEDKLQIPPNEYLSQDITNRIEGIRRALNDNDNGEYLRHIASNQAEAFAQMKTIRDRAPKGGAHKQDAVDLLCMRVMAIYADGNITQSEAAEQLFEQMQANSHTLKGLDLEAWKKMQKWAKTDLSGNLWRNVNRRGVVLDNQT